MDFDIKKILKTIVRKNKGLRDPQLIHPARDWAIGVVGALIMLLGAVLFSVGQYYSYTSLPLDEEVVLDMVSYNTVLVEKALVKYRDLSTVHEDVIIGANSLDTEEQTKTIEGINDDGGDINGEPTVLETPEIFEIPNLAN